MKCQELSRQSMVQLLDDKISVPCCLGMSTSRVIIQVTLYWGGTAYSAMDIRSLM